MPQVTQRIKNQIVEVLYLLLNSAQNHWPDKCIRSVKMPTLCPGPIDEFKIKLLKFFTPCCVQHKIAAQTSALHRLTCPACAPGHSTKSMLNHWRSLPAAMLVRNYQAAKWTKSVKMLSLYPTLSAFTMSTILPSCPTVISILFKPLHSHFFPNTLCIIRWCSLWHPWNTVAFILHRTWHILYMLQLCWFRTGI